FVPVMPSTSRNTHKSGVSPSTSTLCALPLTLMVKAMASSRFPRSDQIDRHVDVAARGLRVWTNLVRFVDQGSRDVARQARQGAREIGGVGQVQVDFGVDGEIGRKSDLLLAGRETHRAFETRRPAGSEQLFRIGAAAHAARSRQPDVEMPIGTTGHAAVAAAG